MEFYNFYANKTDSRELSNFWEASIIIEDRIYNSGEAAFHGSKYIECSRNIDDPSRKQLLADYGHKFEVGNEFGHLTPSQIKQKGSKNDLPLNEFELLIWNSLSTFVQKDICIYKYNTYPLVKQTLDNTRGKIIIHHALRYNDTNMTHRFWEGRGKIIDGKSVVLGLNQLGTIWMEIRDNQ